MKYLAILLTSLLASCASFEEIDRNNFTNFTNFGITSRVEGREQFYMVDHDPIGFTDEKGKAERRIRW